MIIHDLGVVKLPYHHRQRIEDLKLGIRNCHQATNARQNDKSMAIADSMGQMRPPILCDMIDITG